MENGGSLLFAHETRGSDMLFVQCSYHIHIPYSTHSCITGCFRHLKTDGIGKMLLRRWDSNMSAWRRRGNMLLWDWTSEGLGGTWLKLWVKRWR